MKCIFCENDASNSSRSHIFPESLGGGDWAIVPDGTVCSSCNQYFGEKVENLALSSYPFLPFRVLLGIPTKKKKPPIMKSHLGILKGSNHLGHFGLDPETNEIEQGIMDGKITQVRIPAYPTEPVSICRMLVKMGIEVVASDSYKYAQSANFDAARVFARKPRKNKYWWFAVSVNHAELFNKFKNGISLTQWIDNISLSVDEVNDVEVFRLQMLDMLIITPLFENVIPSFSEMLGSPELQLFEVNV